MNNCNNCTHQIEPLRSCEWLEKQNTIIMPPCPRWESKYIDSELQKYLDSEKMPYKVSFNKNGNKVITLEDCYDIIYDDGNYIVCETNTINFRYFSSLEELINAM